MQPVTGSAVAGSVDINQESNRAADANEKTSPSFDQTIAKQAEARPSALDKVADVVDGIRADEARLDRAMRRMSRGRELDSVELLRVQSLVYGYSQRVELASKVVESATSGIKQMLNTQV